MALKREEAEADQLVAQYSERLGDPKVSADQLDEVSERVLEELTV